MSKSNKPYAVEVNGFDPYLCLAETRSRARMACYRAFTEAWTGVPFRQFLDMARVRPANQREIAEMTGTAP